MEQMTVKQLFNELSSLMLQGMGDKKIIVADDNEGNSFHGIYYGCIGSPKKVYALVKASSGLYDSQEKDINNIVIIG